MSPDNDAENTASTATEPTATESPAAEPTATESPAAEPTAAEPSRAAPPSRTLWIGVAILALGAGFIALRKKLRPDRRYDQTTARYQGSGAAPAGTPPVPTGPVAGPAELALIAPLTVGDPLGSGEITQINGVRQGFMNVIVRADGKTFDLGIGIARDGVAGLRAGRYVVYILGTRAPDPASYPIAEALARVIRLHPTVPTPPGMSEGVFGARR